MNLPIFVASGFLGLALALAAAADELWSRLDAATEDDWPALYHELEGQGPAAVRRGLESFAEADLRGRRSRARLAAELGDETALAAVLTLLDAPDERVRRNLVRYLGRSALGDVEADRRLARLAELALDDPDAGVRREALQSIAGSGLASAARTLDALLTELPVQERQLAARLFVDLPAARPLVVRRLRAGLAGASEADTGLDGSGLRILMEAYGRALAETPGAGVDAADRAPILVGLRHPGQGVRVAAGRSFDQWISRLVEFGREERALELLDLFARDGLEAPQLFYRQANLLLSQTSRPEAARKPARLLVENYGAGEDPASLTWRFYGTHFLAVADFAAGEPTRALDRFVAAGRILERLFAEREDLTPSLQRSRSDFPRSPLGGAILVDRLQLLAIEELWQTLCRLAAGQGPDQPLVLEHCRRAHAALLRAQLWEFRTDSDLPGGSWDAVMDRDLAPRRLLLANGKWSQGKGGRALDLMTVLGTALANVCPWEIPGFRPSAGVAERWIDPFADPERLGIFRELQRERIAQLARERNTLVPGRAAGNRLLVATQRLQIEQRGLSAVNVAERGLSEDATPAERLAAYRPFADKRQPSSYASTLSIVLRDQGRSREAYELSQRMLADLRQGLPGTSDIWTEWTSAELLLGLASSLMDEDKAEEADGVGRQAVERLEGLENTMVELMRQDRDPENQARVAVYLRQTRQRLGNALLSLAVNANVRGGDPDKALAYFERAYELDQSDFMRVLLACYRARSGRDVEARAVLSTVEPAPRLYYNLACTHALLGDADLALDWLRRELTENHDTPGAMRRQKQWAADDPDLASLRDDPRFQRLVTLDD